MEKKKVIEYFGSIRKTSEAIGVSFQYVFQWPDKVPVGMAYRVESASKGALKVNLDDYPRDRGRRYGNTH